MTKKSELVQRIEIKDTHMQSRVIFTVYYEARNNIDILGRLKQVFGPSRVSHCDYQYTFSQVTFHFVLIRGI